MKYEVTTRTKNSVSSLSDEDRSYRWVTRFKTKKEAEDHKKYLEKHGRSDTTVTITKIGE